MIGPEAITEYKKLAIKKEDERNSRILESFLDAQPHIERKTIEKFIPLSAIGKNESIESSKVSVQRDEVTGMTIVTTTNYNYTDAYDNVVSPTNIAKCDNCKNYVSIDYLVGACSCGTCKKRQLCTYCRYFFNLPLLTKKDEEPEAKSYCFYHYHKALICTFLIKIKDILFGED